MSHCCVCVRVCWIADKAWRGDEPGVKVQYIVRTSSWLIFTHIRGEKMPVFYSVAGHQIATIFCTRHDSTAVVSCAKFGSDHKFMLEYQIGIIDVSRYCEGQCRLWIWFSFSIFSNCIFSEIKLGVICTVFCYYSLRHVAKLWSLQTDLECSGRPTLLSAHVAK